MNKKLISIAVVAVLIAALGVVLYVLNQNPVVEDSSSSTTESKPSYYLTGSPDSYTKVKSVQIQNLHGSYTIYSDNVSADDKVQAVYAISGLEKIPPSTYSISSVTNSAEVLVATSVVVENPPDISIYGLNKPQATANIKYIDGSTAKIIVGDYAPGGDQAYVMVEGTNTVCLISATAAERFMRKTTDFYDLIVTGGDAETASMLSLALGGTVRPEPIRIQLKEVTTDSGAYYSSHAITAPLKADLSVGKGVDTAYSIFAIDAEEVVDLATDDSVLEKYGLLEPYSTVDYRPQDGDTSVGAFTLKASEPDNDGYAYMVRNDDGIIYRVNTADLKWYEAQVHDMMIASVLLPSITTISSITVKSPDVSYTFDIANEEENIIVTSDGLGIDSDNFRRYYQTLVSATYDEPASTVLEQKPTPILSITFNYNNGNASDTVSYYQGPPRKAYVTLNDDKGLYYMVSTYVDRVLEDANKLIEGLAVKPYI